MDCPANLGTRYPSFDGTVLHFVSGDAGDELVLFGRVFRGARHQQHLILMEHGEIPVWRIVELGGCELALCSKSFFLSTPACSASGAGFLVGVAEEVLLFRTHNPLFFAKVK